ncbi:uncharacterized protein N7477_002084 [Penicillium maclennaniae]|uniref:uncharacterized protein n=1 Tax=Penicillium maclennaniae TaxID=1343394 RepID=UPI002541EC52|nr:uncharacterized protein N7477_002084 [Penicillium maclennaniae]KAJ5682144.1 hypothetical protein N7477_002084 [Penicillium maclennaniae]
MADIPRFPFTVTEHVFDGQHIREYPNATVKQESPVKLVVKKYTPIDNPTPRPGDVTIIGAHGCGFPKEVYEPLWEELLARSRQDSYRIRSIWIADVANLGASGVENEKNLGNDQASWFDHSRDLLYMINKFRDEMPRPIVGVGHSMGAGQLVLLSLLHPRLFTSLSLIEPVLAPDILTGQGPILTIVTLKRPDTWKSRAEAIEAAQKMYKRWDNRVLERWILYAYRDLPTISSVSQADQVDRPVTLTSSKYQEVLQYLRPNPHGHQPVGQEGLHGGPPHDPLLYPDIIGPSHATSPFYRYDAILAWRLLKHVRPPIYYLLGKSSPFSRPEAREKVLNRTGTGIGGSGGVKASRVKQEVIKGTHQLPLEKVAETAASVGPWIGQSIQTWKEDEARIAEGSFAEKLKIFGLDFY